MPEKKPIEDLYKHYLDNTISEEDLADFLKRLDESIDGERVAQMMEGTWHVMYPAAVPVVQMEADKKRFNWMRYVAAAAILIFVVAGVWLILRRDEGKDLPIAVQPVDQDIQAPSLNRATVTLADGRQVYLDETVNGQLAIQGNVKLVKLADGQIVYETGDGTLLKELQYNTLTNPRGSKVIDMQLADGSHVWLNAGSSITYPVAFIGRERAVTIDGEGYFEIAHDADKPFIVKKGAMEVKVLGTHFNVNAYDEEGEIRVTLLEGSVQVSTDAAEASPSGSNSIVLKPAQQSVLTSGKPLHVLNKVDLEAVMAWKNGLFTLKGTGLAGLMRQVARWYDVEVEYKTTIPDIRFGGTISRNVNLSTLLKALNEQGVEMKLEDKKIIVGSRP